MKDAELSEIEALRLAALPVTPHEERVLAACEAQDQRLREILKIPKGESLTAAVALLVSTQQPALTLPIVDKANPSEPSSLVPRPSSV